MVSRGDSKSGGGLNARFPPPLTESRSCHPASESVQPRSVVRGLGYFLRTPWPLAVPAVGAGWDYRPLSGPRWLNFEAQQFRRGLSPVRLDLLFGPLLTFHLTRKHDVFHIC